MKFKFQMENGSLYDGFTEITIKNHIAAITEAELTPSVKLLIEAHGGEILVTEPKKAPAKKRNKGVTTDGRSSS